MNVKLKIFTAEGVKNVYDQLGKWLLDNEITDIVRIESYDTFSADPARKVQLTYINLCVVYKSQGLLLEDIVKQIDTVAEVKAEATEVLGVEMVQHMEKSIAKEFDKQNPVKVKIEGDQGLEWQKKKRSKLSDVDEL